MGGEETSDTSYEVWTLHCPSDAASASDRVTQALRDQIVSLGGIIPDEGEVISWNEGNSGDRQTQLHFNLPDLEGFARVTTLAGDQNSFVVVTIDQTFL